MNINKFGDHGAIEQGMGPQTMECDVFVWILNSEFHQSIQYGIAASVNPEVKKYRKY